jgi:hypothetical protein
VHRKPSSAIQVTLPQQTVGSGGVMEEQHFGTAAPYLLRGSVQQALSCQDWSDHCTALGLGKPLSCDWTIHGTHSLAHHSSLKLSFDYTRKALILTGFAPHYYARRPMQPTTKMQPATTGRCADQAHGAPAAASAHGSQCSTQFAATAESTLSLPLISVPEVHHNIRNKVSRCFKSYAQVLAWHR